ANTSPMAEQLGLVTIKPPFFLYHFCVLMSGTWSPLTSGMMSGTSSAMRKALEFDTTAWPASAKAGSICCAAVASSAAKTSLGVDLSGAATATFMAAILAGIDVARFHFAASG